VCIGGEELALVDPPPPLADEGAALVGLSLTGFYALSEDLHSRNFAWV